MQIRGFLRLWPLVPCFFLPVTAASADTPPEVQTLIDRYGCMSCHGLVHKQVGPGFAQVADRYRTDSTAAVTLASRLRTGTVGHWGRLVMPRQPRMTEAESLTLSRWVLARP